MTKKGLELFIRHLRGIIALLEDERDDKNLDYLRKQEFQREECKQGKILKEYIK